jgi:hypothetical protein
VITAAKHGDLISGLTDAYEYLTRVWVINVNGSPSARQLAETPADDADQFQVQRIEVLGTGKPDGPVEHLSVEVYGSLGKDVRTSDRYVVRKFRSDNVFDGSYLFEDAPPFILNILRENLDLAILNPEADHSHDDCEH